MTDPKTPLQDEAPLSILYRASGNPVLAASANNDSLLNATSRIHEQLALERESALD